jgi:hypothetical protein
MDKFIFSSLLKQPNCLKTIQTECLAEVEQRLDEILPQFNQLIESYK